VPADPLRTRLCELLGIRWPVLLAGMAGGPSTPELVAAVTRAGGLGVFGATGMRAGALADAVRRARDLGGDPVGVNVQVAPATRGPGDPARVGAFLDRFRAELGVDPAAERPPAPDPPEALLEAALTAGARVVTTGLGDPAGAVALARAAGAPVLAMVATVDEARRSVAAGAGAVIAQGAEAGGHRSSFDVPASGDVPLVGTFALVPQVVDAVDVPVVASGGVADGRGLAAALALGAAGASIGTRFLRARESGVPDAYRRRLAALAAEDTVVTAKVTGRPARWIRNRLVDAVLAEGPEPLGWGAQAAALADVRAAAARAGDAELMPMLAGQAAAVGADEMGAAEIVAELVDGARATLRRLASDHGRGR
jgi:nitronate monooxygenase